MVWQTTLRSINRVANSGEALLRLLELSIYKHKNPNWKVVWHQDVTTDLRERIEIDGRTVVHKGWGPSRASAVSVLQVC